MKIKPSILWERVRDSLWFVPGLMTIGAGVLAIVMVRLDIRYFGSDLAADAWWLFGGSPEGARGLLTTVAGSVITVAGVVFSITIVALQLASTQFTPRVLQNFMSDRGNQLVLGVFIGTFAYTILVLRTIRSADENGNGAFVPFSAVTLAILLVLLSMAFLIYYLDHVTRWIEASSIIARITRDTLHEIRTRYPVAFADGGGAVDDAAPRRTSQMGSTAPIDALPPPADAGVLLSRGSGYVQAVDDERILELAVRHDALISIEHAVGDFVLEATTLFRVWPRERLGDDLAAALRDSIALGHRRTILQDPELGILQLSDIAVKSMSPSINDPTTAMLAIDRLGQIIAEFGGRYPRERVQRDERGELRVFRPAFDFEAAVEVAFHQIRRYASSDSAVLSHLAMTIGTLGYRVGLDDRRVLRRILADIDEAARHRVGHDADRRRVMEAVATARRQLGAA